MRNWFRCACSLAMVAGSVWMPVVAAAGDGEAGKRAAADTARQAIREFERSLRQLSELERAQPVREFFASLKDTETCLEAIGMMDSRYQYVIPRNVRAEILATLLQSPDLRVQMRAAQAVGYNGLAAVNAEVLLELLGRENVEAKEVALYAIRSGPAARFTLAIRAHLSHANPRVRHAAASSLWHLEPQARELHGMLQDPDPTVRRGVVHLIPRSVNARALLLDPDPSVRLDAARSMGDSGEASLAPRIAPLLKDESEAVRATAAYALGRLKAIQYLNDILPLLREKDVVVRRQAVLALGDLRSHLSLTALRAVLEDEDSQVRIYAERAIRLIEEPDLNPDSLR